jgi:hypothetical protein
MVLLYIQNRAYTTEPFPCESPLKAGQLVGSPPESDRTRLKSAATQRQRQHTTPIPVWAQTDRLVQAQYSTTAKDITVSAVARSASASPQRSAYTGAAGASAAAVECVHITLPATSVHTWHTSAPVARPSQQQQQPLQQQQQQQQLHSQQQPPQQRRRRPRTAIGTVTPHQSQELHQQQQQQHEQHSSSVHSSSTANAGSFMSVRRPHTAGGARDSSEAPHRPPGKSAQRPSNGRPSTCDGSGSRVAATVAAAAAADTIGSEGLHELEAVLCELREQGRSVRSSIMHGYRDRRQHSGNGRSNGRRPGSSRRAASAGKVLLMLLVQLQKQKKRIAESHDQYIRKTLLCHLQGIVQDGETRFFTSID